MATVWLTYAWEDNRDDVNFVAQELEAAGVTVTLDRWDLRAGIRLWDQIQNHITNPELSDAWLLYATPNSLGSEACKEEFAYALDRALHTRGEVFPVIALFPSDVDRGLIPAGIRTRLFVSLTDPDWKEQVKAAAEGRQPLITRQQILPYHFQVHTSSEEGQKYAIEVRPRAGIWAPFRAAVPFEEKEMLKPSIAHGPRGLVPTVCMLRKSRPDMQSSDGVWWIMSAEDAATPTYSYFIFCNELPSVLIFGGGKDTSYLLRRGKDFS